MKQFGTNTAGVHSEVMLENSEYYNWTTQKMQSHITGNTLEVGCGIGSVSYFINALPAVTSLTAIDIEKEAIAKAIRTNTHSAITFKHIDFTALEPSSYDSIVCSNVIEHIKNDAEAIHNLVTLLKPGGTLCILVPAHQILYSAYDHEVGHYKRYSKKIVSNLLKKSGVQIDSIFYFNAIGAIGWLVVNKIFYRKKANNKGFSFSAKVYERFFLPLCKRLESIISPPFGLSVVALCTKPTIYSQ